MGKVTKEELISDIQELSKNSTVTRNFYRANGKYSESEWQEHFPTFGSFLQAAGVVEPNEILESHESTSDTWSISLPKTRIFTLEQLIDACQIDEKIWEVKKFIANKWEMGEAGGNVTPLFQVKAFLEKRKDYITMSNEVEELKKLAKGYAKVPRMVLSKAANSGLMLEINIPDAHFGKLACAIETGYENYDTKIAKATFLRAFYTLMERCKGYKFDKIIFVVGNDLLNSDNIENTTTKGTAVTTDGRYHKTFGLVRNTMIECIEELRRYAPVKVIMVQGNHDSLSVWHLGDSLECYFHKYPDVEIENSPRYRKYYQHGKVMLLFTHGDKGKKDEYPLLMATEQPEMFGSTRYREAHCGHTHQNKLNEKYGVRVRVLPALCPPDDWHAENGFVGNIREAQAFVWDSEQGLVAQMFYNDENYGEK